MQVNTFNLHAFQNSIVWRGSAWEHLMGAKNFYAGKDVSHARMTEDKAHDQICTMTSHSRIVYHFLFWNYLLFFTSNL